MVSRAPWKRASGIFAPAGGLHGIAVSDAHSILEVGVGAGGEKSQGASASSIPERIPASAGIGGCHGGQKT